ncbi:MAG: large conductance mechanosensitive channel protein MscL [Bacteroidetes bacterium]|nr:MAG: large conductance mechanosensitive channel protein MscL [Bacteroidota bacterium]
MSFLKEFKQFAVTGNVVDLAVGVVIGGAFGTIVGSLVDDVITPLLLNPALKAANVANIDALTWGAVKYGKFIAAIIKFILVALVLFVMLKGINKLKTPPPPAVAPGPTPSEVLLKEIRDALKK